MGRSAAAPTAAPPCPSSSPPSTGAPPLWAAPPTQVGGILSLVAAGMWAHVPACFRAASPPAQAPQQRMHIQVCFCTDALEAPPHSLPPVECDYSRPTAAPWMLEGEGEGGAAGGSGGAADGGASDADAAIIAEHNFKGGRACGGGGGSGQCGWAGGSAHCTAVTLELPPPPQAMCGTWACAPTRGCTCLCAPACTARTCSGAATTTRCSAARRCPRCAVWLAMAAAHLPAATVPCAASCAQCGSNKLSSVTVFEPPATCPPACLPAGQQHQGD